MSEHEDLIARLRKQGGCTRLSPPTDNKPCPEFLGWVQLQRWCDACVRLACADALALAATRERQAFEAGYEEGINFAAESADAKDAIKMAWRTGHIHRSYARYQQQTRT